MTRIRRSRTASPRVTGLGTAARKGCLLLLLSVAFLPFGVPRWLHHDAAPVSSCARDDSTSVCQS